MSKPRRWSKSRDYLALAYRGMRPAGVSPSEWRRTLARHARSQGSEPIPSGWPDLLWQWRNSEDQPPSDWTPQTIVVEDSRAEFCSLMADRLERDAARLDVERAKEPKKTPRRRVWTLGSYSQTRAVLIRASRTGLTQKQASRAYRNLTKLLGHRGVTAEDAKRHPRYVKRAIDAAKRRRKVR